MGQDEFAGFNKENYYCSLTAATYCIKTAAEVCNILHNSPSEKWDHINKKGYVFDKLISDGLYMPHSGLKSYEGKQKHPVQLNAIAYFPLEAIYKSAEFQNTYQKRYSITQGATENSWFGWTLGEFLLAIGPLSKQRGNRKGF